MKKVTLLVALAFVLSNVYGQVKEAKRFMSQGQNNALVVSLQKSDKEEVEKEWLRIVKEFGGKTKKITKTGEIFTDNADIPAMSRNTVDIYALVEERGPDAELVVWFDLGGAFLSSDMHTTRFPYAEKLLNDMSLKVSEAAMEEELAKQETQLVSLSEKLKELNTEKGEITNEIMKYVDKITEAKNKIEAVDAQLKSTQQRYSSQEKAVETAKNRLRTYRDVANR
ncbi:MAG: hypothetical protein AAF960_22955 [Bacteroidota bacterium]